MKKITPLLACIVFLSITHLQGTTYFLEGDAFFSVVVSENMKEMDSKIKKMFPGLNENDFALCYDPEGFTLNGHAGHDLIIIRNVPDALVRAIRFYEEQHAYPLRDQSGRTFWKAIKMYLLPQSVNPSEIEFRKRYNENYLDEMKKFKDSHMEAKKLFENDEDYHYSDEERKIDESVPPLSVTTMEIDRTYEGHIFPEEVLILGDDWQAVFIIHKYLRTPGKLRTGSKVGVLRGDRLIFYKINVEKWEEFAEITF